MVVDCTQNTQARGNHARSVSCTLVKLFWDLHNASGGLGCTRENVQPYLVISFLTCCSLFVDDDSICPFRLVVFCGRIRRAVSTA